MPILGFNKVFSPSEDKTKFEPLENFYRWLTKIYCAQSDEFTFEYLKENINENTKEKFLLPFWMVTFMDLIVDIH